MPNIPTRLILFLSSYAPLFLIVAMRGWRDSRHLAVGLAIVAVLSVVVLFAFLHTAQKLSAGKVSVSSVISRDGDAMSYIVTYLLPFLAVKLNDPTDVISLGIVFVVIGLLYVNSNMIHTNPVLNIVGHHIFEIVDSDGKTTALICKRSYIRTGSEIDAISIGDYVLLEKK
jgi:drug/metabolite transporter (DMT)-like permease